MSSCALEVSDIFGKLNMINSLPPIKCIKWLLKGEYMKSISGCNKEEDMIKIELEYKSQVEALISQLYSRLGKNVKVGLDIGYDGFEGLTVYEVPSEDTVKDLTGLEDV